MNKKVFRKKLLTLLMIISIVATDFFVLGSNLLTYSSDISDETRHDLKQGVIHRIIDDDKIKDIQQSSECAETSKEFANEVLQQLQARKDKRRQ